MGEKLKVISKVEIPLFQFEVELNDGSAASKRPYHIHLQNQRFRLDVPDYEYIQMALVVRVAAEKLKKTKKLENNHDE